MPWYDEVKGIVQQSQRKNVSGVCMKPAGDSLDIAGLQSTKGKVMARRSAYLPATRAAISLPAASTATTTAPANSQALTHQLQSDHKLSEQLCSPISSPCSILVSNDIAQQFAGVRLGTALDELSNALHNSTAGWRLE